MTTRYRILKVASRILIWCGLLLTLTPIVMIVLSILATVDSGGTMRFSEFAPIFGYSLAAALAGIFIAAQGQVMQVLMDIEENTARAALKPL